MIDMKSNRIMSTTLLDVPAPVQQYETWYDFKKDLEAFCGHPILNKMWLSIKPQIALPWDKSNMRLALLKLKKLTSQTTGSI